MDVAELFNYVAKKNPKILEDVKQDFIKGAVALTSDLVNREVFLFLNGDCTVAELHHEMHHIMMRLFSLTDTIISVQNEEIYSYNSTAILEDIVDTLFRKWKLDPKAFVKVK